jgi:TetR/AcrR family transcriptional regulator
MATRDPEATRRRILAAALREFSAKGISGARVDAIAARAKVNKRMIYYYFGSKDGLFREILRRRFQERSVMLNAGAATGVGGLATRYRNVESDPTYVRLLMWESLQTRSDRPVDEAVRKEFFHRWVELVEAEQAAGRVDADLDAAQLILSEMLLVIGPVAFPQLTRLLTGLSVTDPEFVKARTRFLDTFEGRVHREPVGS